MVIEFSGSMEIDAQDVIFIDDSNKEITGKEYLKLPDAEKDRYVLLSVADCLDNCDITFEEIDFFQ